MGRISGFTVAAVAVGGVMVYSAVADIPLSAALRDIVRGRVPGGGISRTGEGSPVTGAPSPGSTVGDTAGKALDKVTKPKGSAIGNAVNGARSAKVDLFLKTALAQRGKSYVWGAAGPNTFDCSGLVTFAAKAAGLDNTRRFTWDYLTFGKAYTVPASQRRAGDLVCWPGHIGIAVNATQMVHAPTAGDVVKIGDIWGGSTTRRWR